ncbi:twin-arginine translocase subunit TatC, partial [bacterium]|nr:twin-arginine translocase subunit TatC [bacterium]
MSEETPLTPAQTFLEHLDELRGAIIRALIGLVVMCVAGYFIADYLQDLLLFSFRTHQGTQLALIAPAEGFIVKLKISVVAGIFLASPWVFYQIWHFVAEGLYPHERKMVLPVVFFSTMLFLAGAAFAYMVLPWAVDFFLSFATPEVENMWSLGRTLDFILRMFLSFGVVFELPIAIYFLARFGLVTPGFLRTYRRHSYIVV